MAPPPQPPELIEELVEQVLLRLPPDDPASLVRAALVCKLWCRLVSGTAFRRRFREFHRGAAPLLGVLYTTGTGDGDVTTSWADDDDSDNRRFIKRARILPEPTAAYFVPTTSYRPAGGRRNGWRTIDAHHGRVLLCHQSDPWCLSVWDPVTDEQRDLPETPLDTLGYSAAVACAAAGGNCCDHLDCHRGPFLVVAIDVQPYVIVFSVYSSEAGAWSNPTILKHQACSLGIMKHTPGVLVGSALYFLVHSSSEIVKFDLATQEVYTCDLPSELRLLSEQRSIVLMNGDDGELGFVFANTKYQLELWSVTGEDARSVQTRVIDLHEVLPSDALISRCQPVQVNGFAFADGGASRFVFMRTSDGLYRIEVNSCHASKVANCCGDEEDDVVPYISFCTPSSKYSFASTGDDVRTATTVQALVSDSAGASPDARPTTATVADSEDDALQKIVPRRRRTQNPRFYGPELMGEYVRSRACLLGGVIECYSIGCKNMSSFL